MLKLTVENLNKMKEIENIIDTLEISNDQLNTMVSKPDSAYYQFLLCLLRAKFKISYRDLVELLEVILLRKS